MKDYRSLCLVGVLCVAWFAILLISGTPFSGYHFTDNHDIVVINNQLNEVSSVAAVATDWIKKDLRIRFRPALFANYVIETKLFRLDFTRWSLWLAAVSLLTIGFLFAFSQRAGFSPLESAIVAISSLLGPHSAAWWKLGLGEPFGMLALAVALWALTVRIHAVRRRMFYGSIYVVSTIAMTLFKESFILIVPAIVFWSVWLQREKTSSTWRQALRANLPSAIILMAVAITELAFIVLRVGTTKIGYAGVSGFQPLPYLRAFAQVAFSRGVGLIIAAGLVLAAAARPDGGPWQRLQRVLADMWAPIVLALLIVLPQVVLHAKSGFYERFYLPGLWGCVVLAAYVLKYLRAQAPAGAGVARGDRWLAWSAIAIGCALLVGGTVLLGAREPALAWLAAVKHKTILPEWHHKLAVLSWLLVMGGAFVLWLWFAFLSKIAGLAQRFISFLLVLFLAGNATVAYLWADRFAREGRNTNTLLGTIVAHTDAWSPIMVVAEPHEEYAEWVVSLGQYLQYSAGRGNLFIDVLPLTASGYEMEPTIRTIYRKELYGDRTAETMPDKRQLTAIVVFPGLRDRFLLQRDWFDSTQYRQLEFNDRSGDFTLYLKR